ncbi:hypothetical protein [Mucilaginibacter aquariorum]|uniref:Uncharacterized protein n=1 Tax=Mucilaginibacter aquariorum TaxID=2967225 RepID=A0ABT1T1J4_9SPHI|nr:hypothetical protein [Mucilaginibacter aquariorum]MCQ6958486.1 hypothetical protein [Mucilaginibacter aquariorum]
MKRVFLLLFVMLSLPCLLFGQRKKYRLPPPLPPSKKENALAEKHAQCFNSHTYNALQRRDFVPFNKALTVKLISFDVDNEPNRPVYDDNGKFIEGDTTKQDTVLVLTPMAKNNFSLNLRKVKEIKTLTTADVDALTEIMYNIGETPVKADFLEIADPGYSCYNPRNAILFMDIKGQITHYIEICFECHRYYFSSSKMRSIAYCTQKMDLLKQFFFKKNIRFGTIRNE